MCLETGAKCTVYQGGWPSTESCSSYARRRKYRDRGFVGQFIPHAPILLAHTPAHTPRPTSRSSIHPSVLVLISNLDDQRPSPGIALLTMCRSVKLSQ